MCRKGMRASSTGGIGIAENHPALTAKRPHRCPMRPFAETRSPDLHRVRDTTRTGADITADGTDILAGTLDGVAGGEGEGSKCYKG